MLKLLLALAFAVSPAIAAAQQPPSTLPRDVQREIVDRWNGANAVRSSDRVEIGSAQDVTGNVAVQGGPLVVAGHVTGDVLAINADVLLRPTARIDGNLIVVGGDVEGRADAMIRGAVRIYRPSLAFRNEGDRIVATAIDSGRDENWWRRFQAHPEANWSQALRVVQAGPYNRVEGLPIDIGPSINRITPWGSVRVDAAAILRTGSTFDSKAGDVGDNLRAEVRFGHDRGIGIGGRAFSIVDPVEDWQLSNLETALASFLARRDYRDYYQRHGGNAYVTLYGAGDLSLTGSFGQERWSSREMHNPFTLFDSDRDWRPNPRVDDGLFHVGDVAFKLDTRTDPDDPWSGWLVDADVENGRGTIATAAPTSDDAHVLATNVGGITDYTRGFLDARRYNRLGPKSQLNMRLVLGGWLGGDQLPLERRLSVDGPGALPGFGFRATPDNNDIDVGTCNAGLPVSGIPAECDRIALAQMEYRGDLRLDLAADWLGLPHRYHGAHGDAVWVLFADAGRGWKVGTPEGTLVYDGTTLPALSTFRSDMGVGVDVSGIGIYVAKALSSPSQPWRFFFRLRHRF